MKNKFEVTDPRGRLVICESEQWDQHILPSHPEMSSKLEVVKSTVSNPDVILGSDSHNDRDIYFQEYGSDIHTKVIVYSLSDRGFVVTAFMQKGIRGNINQGDVKYVKTRLS
jgi:hypothetical protein